MRLRSAALPWLWLGLWACASAPDQPQARAFVDRAGLWPELAAEDAQEGRGGAFPARPLDDAQYQQVKQATESWRAGGGDDWGQQRIELSRDPLTALWLTRMLIVEVLRAQRDVDAASLVGEDRWRRPMQEIVAMGDAAAPCVSLDLLCSSQADRRLLGKQLLDGMGPEHLAAWSRILTVDEVRVRRSAIETIAAWGLLPTTRDILAAGVEDPDFGVRAAAWRGFAGDTPRLAEGLGAEQDPFVRRSIYAALAAEPNRQAAEILVEQLVIAVEQGEAGQVAPLQEALREISGSREDLSVAGWQNWLDSYHPDSN